MKKIIICGVLALSLTFCFAITGCNKNTPVRSQRSSGSIASEFSYKFPYIVSASGGNGVSRNPIKSSVEQSESSSSQFAYNTPEGVVFAIDNLGEINEENYLTKSERLTFIEQTYQALSSDDKQKVTNYQLLVDARNTFDQLVASLNVENIDKFKEKIANLGEFSYTDQYILKLNDALDLYNLIHPTLKPQVESEFNLLSANLQKVFDHQSVEKLIELYSLLPSTITNSTVGKFRKVINDFNNLSASQKALVPNEIQSQITSFAIEIAKNYTTLYAHVLQKQIDNSIFSFIKTTKTQGSGVEYAQENLTDCHQFSVDSKLLVFTPYGGELTIYLTGNSNLSLYVGSEKISSKQIEGNVLKLFLEEMASYTISFDKPTQIYAVEFN